MHSDNVSGESYSYFTGVDFTVQDQLHTAWLIWTDHVTVPFVKNSFVGFIKPVTRVHPTIQCIPLVTFTHHTCV